ncbi:reverse transcriptase domain-containing protein [Salinibacter altiplanensis]|uniref:reverse transcriptase domain-containing protein n=1 Tax=Salinibacter altiplanensis TaxID=1803181 RepID=UPI0018E40865|nr:reverse transcriptase domain-containing protein [Salinibacter altiplanensis]
MSISLDASEEELQNDFHNLEDLEDVADLLDVESSNLIYHIRESPEEGRYKTFTLDKSGGGEREISAPVSALKIIQQKLNQILQAVYTPKAAVHSFLPDRNIRTNAEQHVKQRFVFCVDLKDFFHEINYGRVWGLLQAVPYELPEDVATVLAQICCHNNRLPQGAPTSPIVSNMLCAQLDSELLRLAESNKCIYTRYADDLTFSTSMRQFPDELATGGEDGNVKVGKELREVVDKNGFELNEDKTRLQHEDYRQMVTGLIVNEKVNVPREFVREIRAMLHAWKAHGYEAAEEEFLREYDTKNRKSEKEEPVFSRVIRGKLEFLSMVRGKDDKIYKKYLTEYSRLSNTPINIDNQEEPENDTSKLIVYTEGKTDWKHLKRAIRELAVNQSSELPDLEFNETESDRGDDELLEKCRHTSESEGQHQHAHVFLFDRDQPNQVQEVTEDDQSFRSWGNNVFSAAIPPPPHREDVNISIELYYEDDDLLKRDGNSRRIFLGQEFHKTSGKHKEEAKINCSLLNKTGDENRIIDDRVFNEENENISLSKNDFAEYILNEEPPFDDINFKPFARIFDLLSEIEERVDS